MVRSGSFQNRTMKTKPCADQDSTNRNLSRLPHFFFCRDERQRVYNRNLEVCHDLPHTRDVMPQVVDSQETRQRRRWTLETHDIACQFAKAPDDQHVRRERPHNSCTIGPARVDCMIDLPRGRAGPSRQKGEGEGMG